VDTWIGIENKKNNFVSQNKQKQKNTKPMSVKLTTDEILMVINQNVKDQETKAAILADLRAIEEEKQAEKEDNKADSPKAKNKLTVFIRCPSEHEKTFRESVAFILKSPQGVPDENLTDLIKETALIQNRKVKRKGKINTWAEWFRLIKGTNRKEKLIVNVTKEPVQIIPLLSESLD
jgi:hypothetical protein